MRRIRNKMKKIEKKIKIRRWKVMTMKTTVMVMTID